MKNRFRHIGSALLLLVAACCLCQAMFRSPVPVLDTTVHAESTSIENRSNDSCVASKPIEKLRVGERVLAHNPEITSPERRKFAVEPDWSTWRKLTVQMVKEDESTLQIEILRPTDWLESQLGFLVTERPAPPCHIGPEQTSSASPDFMPDNELLLPFEIVGISVELELPEMGAVGTGVVTDISECPEIPPGDGQVITATFHHPPSAGVLDVKFIDETSWNAHEATDKATPIFSFTTPHSSVTSIGVTQNHLFWSADRQQFVPVGKMEIGERVQTYHGETKRIASKLPRPGPPATVYNLEVYGEHVYFAGELLVHNTSGVMVDTGVMRNFVAESSNMRHVQKNALDGRTMVATEVAVKEFRQAMVRTGSLTEKLRANRLLNRIRVVPDEPSTFFANLTPSNKLGAADLGIFGTADRMGIQIFTTDKTFMKTLFNKTGHAVDGIWFAPYVR